MLRRCFSFYDFSTRIAQFMIAWGGTDSICLFPIQLLEHRECVLRALGISVPLISLGKLGINRGIVRIELVGLFQMRNRLL